MQRMATTFALSSWLGFCAVSAGLLLLHGALPEAAPSPRDAQLAVLALLAAVASMSAALVDLHGKRTERRARGEWRGTAGLLMVAAVAGAGQLTGNAFVPAEVTGASFWMLLALGIAAIVFDRLMSVETDIDAFPDSRVGAMAHGPGGKDGPSSDGRRTGKP